MTMWRIIRQAVDALPRHEVQQEQLAFVPEANPQHLKAGVFLLGHLAQLEKGGKDGLNRQGFLKANGAVGQLEREAGRQSSFLRVRGKKAVDQLL
jgi:hypothetical protein